MTAESIILISDSEIFNEFIFYLSFRGAWILWKQNSNAGLLPSILTCLDYSEGHISVRALTPKGLFSFSSAL